MTPTNQLSFSRYAPNIQGAIIALAASYSGGVLNQDMLDQTIEDYQSGDPGTYRQIMKYISPTDPSVYSVPTPSPVPVSASWAGFSMPIWFIPVAVVAGYFLLTMRR